MYKECVGMCKECAGMCKIYNNPDHSVLHHLVSPLQRVKMNVISAAKPHACHLCDKRFGRRYSLRRHVESLHTDEESQSDVDSDTNSSVNYEPQLKKSRVDLDEEYSETESTEDEHQELNHESETEGENDEVDELTDEDDDSTEEDDSSSDLEDNVTFLDWLAEAKESIHKPWSVKYEKYISEGLNADQAKEKANRKTRWDLKRMFFNRYKDFLTSYLHLQDNETHLEVVEDLEDKVHKGMDVNKALNRVMPKHWSKFKALFHHEEVAV